MSLDSSNFGLMDNRIIEDFQNLHVLAAYDLAVMDDLVHDLTVALDESSKAHRSCRDGSCLNRDSLFRRRRRFKKRKADNTKAVNHENNLSETSESSLDEAFKDYLENVSRQSDSDEFLVNGSKIPAVHSFPILSIPQFVESDSVTENITPLRPQRRRRHFKRMAVDSQSPANFNGFPNGETDFQRIPSAESLLTAEASGCVSLHLLSGKRKRSSKDKGNSFDLDHNDDSQTDGRVRCQGRLIDGNVSSLSSDESERGNSTGAGRDGDDEESDAYHESEGEVSADISAPNVTDLSVEKMDVHDMNADMQKIFAAGLDILSPTSRSCFKARMKMLSGRQIHAGRRRLKDQHPTYSLSAFIQERQMWNRGCSSRQQPVGIMTQSGSSKRHRRMLSTDPNLETEQSESPAFNGILNSNNLLFGIHGTQHKLFTIGQKSTRSPGGHHSLLSLAHHFVS